MQDGRGGALLGGHVAAVVEKSPRETAPRIQSTLAIRGGAGLGDALYIQAVARHLIAQGHNIEACSAYPDVFRPLGNRVTVSPFRRKNIDRLAHYSLRRHVTETDQFQDCCIQAGIREPVELRLDWQVINSALVQHIRVQGKPVVAVSLPRSPMDRTDGYGDELLPDCAVIQRAIDRLKGRAFLVQIGAGVPKYRFDNIDLDLTNRTSLSDLLDVAAAADAFLGYASFIVPLSASLGKPALLVWARAGLNSKNEIIRWLTPRKVLHGKRLQAVIDDCSDQELTDAVDALCEQTGYSPAL